MPYRANRPCKHRGCPGVAIDHGYCKDHRGMYKQPIDRSIYDRQYDSKRKGAGARGYNSEWEKIREPLIKDSCHMCRLVKAQMVHHDPPYIQGTDHRQYTLVPLCFKCHKKIHSEMLK